MKYQISIKEYTVATFNVLTILWKLMFSGEKARHKIRHLKMDNSSAMLEAMNEEERN